MKINWKVRIKNYQWWLAIVPAVFLLAQVVLVAVGIEYDLTNWQAKILAVLDPLFMILVLLGVNVDYTTKGIKDSPKALKYDRPN